MSHNNGASHWSLTFPKRMWSNDYSIHIGTNHRPKKWFPESSQWTSRYLTIVWLKGKFREHGWLKIRCIINKSPPKHGWQLTQWETWSALHSHQAAPQVEECPFQVPQVSRLNLFQEADLVWVVFAGFLLWESSLKLSLLESWLLSCLSLLCSSASEVDSQSVLLILIGRGLVNLVSFRDFLKLFWVTHLLT